MKVFVARHGEASFDAPSDHERPLTERGESVSKALVLAHLDELQQIQEIWCSHLTRAVQTATLYADALSLKLNRKTFLSPEGSPSQVIRQLEKKQELKAVLLVSHQPLVGDLVGQLCGDPYSAHPFVTSEVVVLDMDYPAAGMAEKVADFLP